jgi:ribosomal protein S27AE
MIMARALLKSVLMLTLLLITTFLVVGCRVDSELWIDKTGAGHGKLKITGWHGSKAELESELKKSFKDFSLRGSGSEYTVKLKWNKLEEIRRPVKMRTEPDGTIMLDLGLANLGSITVHVDGTIDKEKTGGKIKNSNSVVFESGRAVVYYKPGTSVSKTHTLKYAIVIFGIAVIGIVVFAVIRKRKLNAVSISGNSSRKARFCSKCGSSIHAVDTFCGECGGKIGQ